MTIDEWSITSSILGFVGSIVLFYPGWRASRSLQHLERIRALVDSREPAIDPQRDGQTATADKQTDDATPAPQQQSSQAAAANNTLGESHAGDSDPGPELLEIIKEQKDTWRPLEHGLLMFGILLIALSFAVDLFIVKPAS